METITLTRKFTNTNTFTRLKIYDKDIEEKTTVKLLGVTLDKRLRFCQHITNVINRTYITLSKLYPLVNRRSRLSTDNKVTLYKTLFRPIMTYACASWNTISDTQCKRLQTTQNKLLRLLTNSDRYVNINELHLQTKTPKIRDYINETSQTFFKTKIQTSELTRDITHIRHYDNYTHTHKLLHENLPLYHDRRT